MRTLLLSLLWLLAAMLSACALARPTVIASIHPYADLLRQVAGDKVDVIRLLDPGSSPHTFDPSPRDVVQIAEADLIVLNGGLDEWLLELVEASGTEAPVFEAVSELEFEPIGGVSYDEAGYEAEGEHDHSGLNPHIWLDPVLMARITPLLADALSEVDPENAGFYHASANALVADLNALHGELEQVLEPIQGKAFVPFHDAWPYFARRYGFDLILEIEPAPGREPSPSHIAEAIERIQQSGAKAIFGEVQLPERPAEVVAENAGVELYLLDPLGGGNETGSYQELMRYNARVVAEALGE